METFVEKWFAEGLAVRVPSSTDPPPPRRRRWTEGNMTGYQCSGPRNASLEFRRTLELETFASLADAEARLRAVEWADSTP